MWSNLRDHRVSIKIRKQTTSPTLKNLVIHHHQEWEQLHTRDEIYQWNYWLWQVARSCRKRSLTPTTNTLWRSFKHYRLLQQSHLKGVKESQTTASKAAESFKEDTPPCFPLPFKGTHNLPFQPFDTWTKFSFRRLLYNCIYQCQSQDDASFLALFSSLGVYFAGCLWLNIFILHNPPFLKQQCWRAPKASLSFFPHFLLKFLLQWIFTNASEGKFKEGAHHLSTSTTPETQ